MLSSKLVYLSHQNDIIKLSGIHCTIMMQFNSWFYLTFYLTYFRFAHNYPSPTQRNITMKNSKDEYYS